MTIDVSTVPEMGDLGLKVRVDRAAYLQDLLSLRSSLPAPLAWLHPSRDRAEVRLQELAIPSTRDEEWRFTDLSALVQTQFSQGAALSVSPTAIAPFLLPEAASSRLVFVNGVYVPELSAVADLPAGVFVGSLAQASETDGLRDQLPTYLAQQQQVEETFTALNTASFTDGAIVWIPKNQVLEAPIHLLFVSAPGHTPTFSQPRCLVVAETGSSVTLVESFVALEGVGYFTNPVTEIWVRDNARVNHTRVQNESARAFHIGKTAVSQGRDSHYTCHAITLGAQLSRHNLEVFQAGEQTQTHLNGLTLIREQQLADTHSVLALTKPHGTSQQVHKCIVDDRAHAVFNGKIFVPKPAQLTDAAQLSRNLLLSPRARVDTKPQLEITADNVKCAHGATVSQLDDDEVFYLQSRGLGQDMARQLLVHAFAIEVIDQIPVASLRDYLATAIRL